ncbi:CPBP family intramembrane glutamic endopeptidase [Bacillus sp. CGMCC 1.60114]|uniref:CPBP family intramembrane glutamic endopeptidase n=1 Tax=unclassified Bacillus (in: firmicutes) TaxID=185979 RepID=UPI00362CE6BD
MSVAKSKTKFIMLEMLLVMIVSLGITLFVPGIGQVFTFLPIIYLVIEKVIRKRKFWDIGFRFSQTASDLKTHWFLALFVGVIIPILCFLFAKYMMPEYALHIKERVPMMSAALFIPLLFGIIVGTFVEEMIYRAFFQERLSWFTPPTFAILCTSFVFGLMHFAKGDPLIVAIDIGMVFVDSILYGLLFHRTKNIFASWIPHLASDVIGIICLVFFL